MAAGQWTIYNEFKATLGLKALNLNTDAMKVALFTSASNVGNAALVNAWYPTATGEVPNTFGYLSGGVSAAPTYSQAGGTATFDTADASWTASGGNIVARYAVLYDHASVNKDLIAFCLLDATPADVTVSAGNSLTIQIANIFTLT